MRTGLRRAAVLAAAIAISFTSPGELTGVASAVPCLRTVGIEPQVSTGEGGGALTFNVFTEGCTLAGDVEFTTSSGTAIEGKDFGETSGALHWNVGETGVKTISVRIGQDLSLEANIEDFSVQLSNPSPTVEIVNSVGQGRIFDDDGETPLAGIDDSACIAAMPDPKCLCQSVFQVMPYIPSCARPAVHLNELRLVSTIVSWKTWNGSAIAGVDYVPVPAGVQVIPAGRTTADLLIHLIPRPGAPRREFYVQLTAVSQGVIIDGLAVITIHGT